MSANFDHYLSIVIVK